MEAQQRCKIWLVFEKILTLIRHPAAKGGNLSYKTRLAEQVYLGSRGLLREIFVNNPKPKASKLIKVVFGAELRNSEVISKVSSASEV